MYWGTYCLALESGVSVSLRVKQIKKWQACSILRRVTTLHYNYGAVALRFDGLLRPLGALWPHSSMDWITGISRYYSGGLPDRWNVVEEALGLCVLDNWSFSMKITVLVKTDCHCWRGTKHLEETHAKLQNVASLRGCSSAAVSIFSRWGT